MHTYMCVYACVCVWVFVCLYVCGTQQMYHPPYLFPHHTSIHIIDVVHLRG